MCSCGDTMHKIKELVSEQYDIVPAKFQVIQNVRFVYGCRCGEKPSTTALSTIYPPKDTSNRFILSNYCCTKV
ncbi:MAG: IS66 family transposase zinc-finger binding domain-containing protein [Sulfurovum sp.]|nr:IS66 family transposase zinc-finger binding domain-containing protein [Sulfurovum sp.]MDQ7047985.1 IS66 family transposase zinc-finger binding domain-containing protein [Sulfurovum sp.]